MKKFLGLSVITGNCEQDIHRFLDAFQPHFDEIVMVRAIGSAKPDKTLDIAKERGCVVGEYRNAAGNDWPHVDDFSAARNMALGMLTTEWGAWADLDDLAAGLENAREYLAGMPAYVDFVSCPYVVSEQGVIGNFRERFWRISRPFRWVNALHENLVCDEPAGCRKTDKIQIIHKPREDRDCSKERNMRILESIPQDKRTRAHAFYLCMEYARRKDPRAIETARAFLADPESCTPERFELFMTLAAMAEELPTKANYYTQALTEDPTRSEPLYELAAISLACEQPERALAYARMMMQAEWPENPCWNHRAMFYGFFREDLYLQCLRADGRVIESDTRRANITLETELPIISLCHATRGRPAQATRARMEWLRMADHPERIEHIFVMDDDDETADALFRFRSYLVPSAGPVAAWNAAARVSIGEVLVQLSDDWRPFKGWDTAILQAMGDLDDSRVLAVSDGSRKDDLLCMAIMTRARYKQQGHMFHPDFFSMFSDNWFSECAFRDGVVIDARDRITFEHIHPAFGKAPLDETYARTNAAEHYQSGMATLEKLRNQ